MNFQISGLILKNCLDMEVKGIGDKMFPFSAFTGLLRKKGENTQEKNADFHSFIHVYSRIHIRTYIYTQFN